MLPPSDTQSGVSYSGYRESDFCLSSTGLSPSLARRSSRPRVRQLDCTPVRTPHPLYLVDKGFGLTCSAFSRPYSPYHFCFLFLRLLRCFNSPRSLSEPCGPECKRMSYSVIRGSKAACVSPRLIAACHDLRRLSSQAILQTAWELAIFVLRTCASIISANRLGKPAAICFRLRAKLVGDNQAAHACAKAAIDETPAKRFSSGRKTSEKQQDATAAHA